MLMRTVRDVDVVFGSVFRLGIAGSVIASCTLANDRATEVVVQCRTPTGAYERVGGDTVPFYLTACAVYDTVAVGENILVTVLLVNRGGSALFTESALEPGQNVFFRMISPGGEPYAPLDTPYASEPMRVRLDVLPRHGIIGRTVGVLCDLPGDVILETSEEGACEPSIRPSELGTYTITVQALIHWCRDKCSLGQARSVLLESKPIPVVVR